MKKVLITCMLCMFLLTGCKSVPKLSNGEEVIAQINGKEFTANELYEDLKLSYGANALVNMIDTYIVGVEIEDRTDANVYGEAKVAAEKATFESYGDAIGYTWEQYLTSNGFASEDEFVKYYEDSYLREEVAKKYIIPEITDKEIEKYYDEEIDDKIVARHIVVIPEVTDDMTSDEKKEAEQKAYDEVVDLIKKLDAGEEFSELAKKHSDDGSADDGGLLDAFTSADVDSDFWKAALELKVGKYSSEPVKSKFGYHIILKEKVIEKESLDSMKDDIKESIATKKLSSDSELLYKTWFEIRKKYNLELNDSDIKYVYQISESQYIK